MSRYRDETMTRQNRRTFLKSSIGALAAGSLAGMGYAETPTRASGGEGLRLGETGPIYQAAPGPALDLTDEVTLEAWVKADPMPAAGGRILDKSVPGTSDGYMLDTYPGNSIRLVTQRACSAAGPLVAGRWNHVAGVYSSSRKIIKLYLDGKVVAASNSGPFPPMTLTRVPLCVGADPEGGNRFRGRILRAAIYHRALSDDEIARRAAAGPLDPPAVSGAIGDWRFASKPVKSIAPERGVLALNNPSWIGTFTGEAPPPEEPLSLWYRQPAQRWLEALPIGSGRLGAMVFGGVVTDRLQLNEGTLWAGGPHDYSNPEGLAALPEIRRLVFAGKWQEAQSLVNAHFMGRPAPQMQYQTVGELQLSFDTPDVVSNYRRELDLKRAIARVSYSAGGVQFRRETFASAPDEVIVMRLTADRPGKISFTAAFDTPQKASTTTPAADTLALDGISGDSQGIPGAVRFHARALAHAEGGAIHASNGRLQVTGANAVTLFISIATSYRSYQDVTGDAEARALEFMNSAARHPYDRLRRTHETDHQRLFDRVSFDLSESSKPKGKPSGMMQPTDERVKAFDGGNDPDLAALHFQFGRYLLISCSRAGGQPATLQGLWNDSMSPPWGSKYTININTEMNYWPTGPANLLECYAPLFAMLSDLPATGAKTAKTEYGAEGWVCHHNTDAWRGAAPVDYSFSGMWPSGGAWLCKSFWDHYEFTRDQAALKRHYPIMKGAAEFFLNTLVEEPVHHWLVTNPSISPENAHHPGVSICAGPTMDMQILRDLFQACADASQILGVDEPFREQILAARARLAPMRIGHLGQLQEWLEDWDGQAPEQHHRHVSHLYGVYPGAQITWKTPELLDAAKKSLEMRGDAGTGWSLAWKINLRARLGEGDHALRLISDLITPEHTAPNLFDLHPPFQIDGNFGGTSGIAEMLLQSHAGEVHLLPALPAAWPQGSVRGLLARGAFEVDMTWSGGKLTHAEILSRAGEPCKIRSGTKVVDIETKPGRRYRFDGSLTQV